MVIMRKWQAGVYTMMAPYYDELLPENGGFLPRDVPAHALWHYYMIARRSYELEKDGFAYEGDVSPDFNGEQTFRSIALVHGCNPNDMIKFWPVIETQARMMGDDGDLPPRLKFRGKISS